MESRRERVGEVLFYMISSALHLSQHTHIGTSYRTSPRPPLSLSYLSLSLGVLCVRVTVKRVTLFGLSVKNHHHTGRENLRGRRSPRGPPHAARWPRTTRWATRPRQSYVRQRRDARPKARPSVANRRAVRPRVTIFAMQLLMVLEPGVVAARQECLTVQRSHRVAPGQRRERRSKSFRPKRALKGSSWGSYGASGRV